MSDLHPDADSASPGSDRYTATPAPTFGSRAPVDPNDRYTATPAPIRQHYSQPGGSQPVGSTTLNYKPIASLSRPGSVTSAVGLTWFFLAIYAFIIIRFIIGAVTFEDRWRAAFGYSFPSEGGGISTFGIVVGGSFLVWIFGALVVSFFAAGGQSWARLALVISGGLSIPFQLLTIGYYLLGLIGAMATVAIIIVLFTPDANDWYRRMS